jgi:hypothetical protein
VHCQDCFQPCGGWPITAPICDRPTYRGAGAEAESRPR